MTGGEIAGWGLAVLAAFMTLIQVSPLKLNPWDRILAWLGQKLNSSQIYRSRSRPCGSMPTAITS